MDKTPLVEADKDSTPGTKTQQMDHQETKDTHHTEQQTASNVESRGDFSRSTSKRESTENPVDGGEDLQTQSKKKRKVGWK